MNPMNWLSRFLPFFAALLICSFFPHSTKSTEVGVRVIKWSPFAKKGIVQEIYLPGATYFFPLFINEWYTFDTRLHNIEMTTGYNVTRKDRDDLLFKTIDGNDISLDVTISYRVDPAKAPQILERAAVNNYELEEKVVRTITRSITRDIFGELKTEDFYVTSKRTEKADLVKQSLNTVLNPYGVIVESVLPRDYRFNPAYQKAIEEKKVADQMTERFKSEAKAVVEEYNQKVQQAQGEVNKMVAQSDGEYQKAKISADAYYEQQALIAQAIEKEGLAEAQGIEKMVDALNSSGGKTMVKLRLAEALIGKRIFLLPTSEGSGLDLKTTNVNELLKIYGIQAIGR
ncbi:MAG: SPFH domain-containing protein [Candidatus Omnitrophica bacterium]|nr:SPFH domain-containing protein [Candidatus Omnitrophota bacterium]